MGVFDKLVSASKKASTEQFNKVVGGEDTLPKAESPQEVPAPKRTSPEFGGRRSNPMDVSRMVQPLLGSFKKGTTHVPKTGVYKLHEGEAVVPKEDNPMSDWSSAVKHPAKSKKVVKEIRTRKAKDGSYIHEHHHHSAEHKMEEHTSPDMAGMMAHMAQNAPEMSADPNAGAPPDAGAAAGAAPAAQAQPAM